MIYTVRASAFTVCLNESPSEKEGKCLRAQMRQARYDGASMKALPKRKGNPHRVSALLAVESASMKALPKRKGNIGSYV